MGDPRDLDTQVVDDPDAGRRTGPALQPGEFLVTREDHYRKVRLDYGQGLRDLDEVPDPVDSDAPASLRPPGLTAAPRAR